MALHVDHIWPVAAGGTDDEWNLAAACEDCNQGKRDYCIEMVEGPSAVLDGLHEACGVLKTADVIRMLFAAETDLAFSSQVIHAAWGADYDNWLRRRGGLLQ